MTKERGRDILTLIHNMGPKTLDLLPVMQLDTASKEISHWMWLSDICKLQKKKVQPNNTPL